MINLTVKLDENTRKRVIKLCFDFLKVVKEKEGEGEILDVCKEFYNRVESDTLFDDDLLMVEEILKAFDFMLYNKTKIHKVALIFLNNNYLDIPTSLLDEINDVEALQDAIFTFRTTYQSYIQRLKTEN